MKKIRAIYGISSLLSLLAGFCIYLMFRNIKNMLLFHWIPKLEFSEMLFIQLSPSIWSNMLRYNLPDMLWFVSGILFLRFLWFYRSREQKIYVFWFYVMGAAFELSQSSEKVPGTFDLLDLIFMGIGAFVEGLLYNNFVKRRLR